MNRQELISEAKKEIRSNKLKAAVYLILRLSIIAVMIVQILNKNYNDVFMCILALILFMIPTFIYKRLNITLPNTLEIIILLFIYSAAILGEIGQYYLIYDRWDDMLHTINGFLFGAVGLAMIDILNRSEKFHFEMSARFVAMVSFCFSMTIGVIWEFFEYFMDKFFFMDMQKDTIISSITSVTLNPEGINVPVTIDINSIVINGTEWMGYIDIGLIDTVSDLFVNFIGAVIFSIFGYYYIKDRGDRKFIERFIPKLKRSKK
ncbi:MAG: hypothetical protein PHV71_02415 [Eubacteriales bacterium]|nr:hypothetical protein [Eubacteriales bacterium]MDD3199073.1 hypothetical protein [Eubacteriales bacterium]MDD4629441.1 hypothetical protein [Eubacteriales bacterium]